MGLSLTKRQQESLSLVDQYFKANPGTSLTKALKSTGVNIKTYRDAQQKVAGKPVLEKPKRKYRKRKPKFETLVIPETIQPSKLIAFVGSYEDVVRATKAMWSDT